MSLQKTVTTEAAAVAEKAGVQATAPTVIADATGGVTVDAEARAAVNAVLALLRTQGITTAS